CHPATTTFNSLPLHDALPIFTAAFTASRAVAPIVNTPWLRMSTAGDRDERRVSTTPRPMLSSPISANGPTGIGPPNSSAMAVSRSEEHTSELQSLAYLVCRLL